MFELSRYVLLLILYNLLTLISQKDMSINAVYCYVYINKGREVTRQCGMVTYITCDNVEWLHI